jgi:molybdopterin synthase sulfur carrier subunit
MTIQGLFDHLEEKYPGIRKKVLASSALTINLEYIDLDIDNEGEVLKGEDGDDGKEMVIREGDEVGIIPPVSSG